MKQIFDWLREQMRENSYDCCESNYSVDMVVDEDVAIRIVDEAEAKFGGHAICYLDSPCEYQNEDIRVDEEGDYCELLDKLIEPTPCHTHGLCAFRSEEECVGFEHCENCVVDAVKDILKNADSRFRKISEVEQ